MMPRCRQKWGSCRKTFLLFILINSLLGEWHFHLSNLKSEDLGMSVLVNHPGFQEQRRQFCIFVISPLLYKQLGLWSWLRNTVNFCLEKCAQLSQPAALFTSASGLSELPSVGQLAILIWCWGHYLTLYIPFWSALCLRNIWKWL